MRHGIALDVEGAFHCRHGLADAVCVAAASCGQNVFWMKPTNWLAAMFLPYGFV